MGMKILYLTLYRKWFDMIARGEKIYEFRSKTPYWNKRLGNKEYNEIWFTNGYGKKRPFMRVEYKGLVTDNPDTWIICLGKVLEVKNV